MAVGKNSIRRAAASSGSEQSAPEKSSPAKKPAVKKDAARTAAKAASKSPEVKEVKTPAAAVKPEKNKLRVNEAEGVNAHYGVNTPLPTFLL